MQNNIIFLHIVQSLAIDSKTIQTLFAAMGIDLDEREVANLCNMDDSAHVEPMPDYVLVKLLDALIDQYRGKKTDPIATQPPGQIKVSNNDVLKKLRIALNLHEQDLRDALKLVTIELTKSDLSALFRNAGHAQYKACDDELLMDFITGFGLLLQQRQSEPEKNENA